MSTSLHRWTSALAAGDWATPERLRAYPAILLGLYATAAFGLVLTGSGNVDLSGRPIGADFGMVWAAGQTALDGRPEDVYSLGRQEAAQSALFGTGAGFTPWHYPPIFLLVAAPLAALPYLWALALWQGLTLAGFLASIRACAGGRRKLAPGAILLAAAFPASFINLAHGQNGFLTAGLLAGGLLSLRTRPVAAGALFALLAYKPQFCLLVPVILLAGGHWRAIASSILASTVIGAITTMFFGIKTWTAFLGSAQDAKRLTLETGATGWEKIQSVFGALRLIGLDFEPAMAVQVVVAACVAAAVAIVWRSQADERLKQAAVLSGVLLTTPYCIDYDMVVLAPALTLLACFGLEKGFARYEISLAALVFVTPLIARLAGGGLHAPLGAAVMLAFHLWILARAVRNARDESRAPRDLRISQVRPLLSARRRLSP